MKSRLMRSLLIVGSVLAIATSAAAQGIPATPAASPVSGGPWNTEYVGGNGFDVLTPAPDGTVAVIAMGDVGAEMPVLIHNNTEVTIDELSVEVVVRDGDGNLFEVASGSRFNHNPGRLVPGGIGLSMVTMSGATLPVGATLEPRVGYRESTSADTFGSLPGQVVDWRRQDTAVTGIVANPHPELAMTSPLSIQVACVAADGVILSTTDGDTEQNEIPPGEATRFHATLPGPACDYLLIIASGNNFN